MHLVDFIITIYHDARSAECQNDEADSRFSQFCEGAWKLNIKSDISGSRLGWSECRERHLAVWQTGQVKHEKNMCDDDDGPDDDDDDGNDKNMKVFSQLTWSGMKQFVKYSNKNNPEIELLCLCVPHTFIHSHCWGYF